MANLEAIRSALANGKAIFGPHARREMARENPTLKPAEIEEAVAGPEVFIITAYVPDPLRWEDYRRRWTGGKS